MAEDKNTPFSVRMEQEDKRKLIKLIEDSGAESNKEFMITLMNAYELNKVKLDIPQIAQDIEGLQALTQRINDYYVNIGKRIEDIQKSKDIEFTKEVEVYKSRIEGLKNENDKLTNDFEGLQQSYNNVSADYEEMKKQLDQNHESLRDKTLLVEEYKQKNDTMTGLLNEYKQYKTESEEFKKLLSAAQTKNMELNNNIKDDNSIIQELKNKIEIMDQTNNKTIQELNTKHEAELETIREKFELQKDKSLLELKAHHQQEQQELQHKHNVEIQDYQNKYKELLNELEKINTNPRKNKNQTNPVRQDSKGAK